MIVLQTVIDSVEFYTVQATGESGLSQSGLAKLAGISRTPIATLETTLAQKAPAECLEAFVGIDLTLRLVDDVLIDSKAVGNLIIYKADFCSAALEYFGFEKGKKEAMFSFRKFAKKGFVDWIQGINNWQPAPLSLAEICLQNAQALVNHERMLAELKEEQRLLAEGQRQNAIKLELHDQRLEGIEAEISRFSNGHGDYYSIVAWSRIMGKQITRYRACALGKEASKLCRETHIPIETVRDPRYGLVNSYPESVLQAMSF